MKRFFFFVVFLFEVQSLLMAQVFSNEYGKVGKEDVDYSFYPNDKSAEAVVIYDIGQSYFSRVDDYYQVIYERSTRIKVFKEAGIKFANIEIPFYGEGELYENVYDLEACTYNILSFRK